MEITRKSPRGEQLDRIARALWGELSRSERRGLPRSATGRAPSAPCLRRGRLRHLPGGAGEMGSGLFRGFLANPLWSTERVGPGVYGF